MRYVPIVLVATALLVACGGAEDAPKEVTARSEAEALRAFEDSLFTPENPFSEAGARTLLAKYAAFVDAYPLDTLVPEYLFRAASMKVSLRDPEGALRNYSRIMRDFNDWHKMPDVLYLRALTIDRDLGQKGEAQRAYQELIDRYPDDRFTQDARRMIEMLGLSDEEILERIRQNKDTLGAGV